MGSNNRLDLGDYFLDKNGEYLSKICYEYLKENCRVLEIGSWKGKSTSIIAEAVKEKSGKLYCIDTWKGSEGEVDMESVAKENDIFNIFRNNLKILGLDDVVVPIVADSKIVRDLFRDEYFDLIFVDGNHKYDFVIADLINYLPKLKPGGIICGDDCEGYAGSLPLEYVDANKNNDWTVINNKGYHCGVIYALYEKFNDTYNIGDGSTFWWKIINKKKSSPNKRINLIYGNSNLSDYDKTGEFITLDIKSLQTAFAQNLNSKYLEDFIGIDNFTDIKLISYNYNLSWYLDFNLNFKINGISIPEIDIEYLRWFWFHALVLTELKEIAAEQSIEFHFEGKSEKPAAYYGENFLTEYILGKKKYFSFPRYQPISNIPNVNYKNIEDKIVLVLHPGEYDRFKDIVNDLFTEFRDKFSIILIYRNNNVERLIKDKYKIEVNYFENIEEIDIEQWYKNFDHFTSQLSDKPLHNLIKETLPEFEHLFLDRFPNLHRSIKSWSKIFNDNKPKAVIGSRLPDAETQIPLAVASQLKIPVFSIPHGVDPNLPFNILKSNVNILTSHQEEVSQYLNWGWKESNVHLVKGLELFNEYSPDEKTHVQTSHKKKILVLVNPCGYDNIIYRAISVPKQIKSIAKLAEFANQSSEYEILFKTHPGFPNKEIFDVCGPKVAEKLLPIESSLSNTFEMVDLVVGLNYSEAAVIHSLNSTKPTLLCWNDPFYKDTKIKVGDFYETACMLTYSVEELIEKIISFFENDAFKSELINKTKNYLIQKSQVQKQSYLEVIKNLILNSNIKLINAHENTSSTDMSVAHGIPLKNYSPKVSIIIPTRNRCGSLKNLLDSIIKYNLSSTESFEVIVVDNGSTDDTKEVCEKFISEYGNFKYKFEPEPGLLSARHAGAQIAKGDILTFVDDDIEVSETWFPSIIRVFADERVHLAGGPTVPIFESEVPGWILFYFRDYDLKLGSGYLSLYDAGDYEDFIKPTQIWGLNFSVRRSTFFEVGGFNPDNINKELQYYQGDGETGLAYKIAEKNYKAYYSKEIKVYHNIYNERLTLNYFKERNFYQGVCDSYTQLRKKKDLKLVEFPNNFFGGIPPRFYQYKDYYEEIYKYYMYGFLYHQLAVRKSEVILNWVLKENYFDYKLPKLPQKYIEEMGLLRKNLSMLDKLLEVAS